MQGLINRVACAAAVSLCCFVSSSVLAQDLESAREAIRKKDFAAASEALVQLDSKGNAEARYLLAGLHRRGLGVSRNAELAADIYTELADGGYEHAVTLQRDTQAAEWPALVNPEDAKAALFWSAQTGRVEVMEALLDSGTNPDARSLSQRTPMMIAAESGRNEIVDALLERGANPNLTDDSGHTALLLAARRDRLDVVKRLLGSADLNIQDTHGNTALIVAARKNNQELVATLVAAGANLNRTNDAGQTALGIAKIRGHRQVGRLLEQRGGIAQGFVSTGRASSESLQLVGATPGDRPIWFVAADRGNVSAASQLLTGGSKVDRTDSSGSTALMIAAERDHEALVDLLLANGANPKLGRASDGWSALHLAAAAGRAHLLRRMLTQTLPPYPATSAGEDILMLAIESDDRETIAAVLEVDVDIKAADTNGRTALMRAAARSMNTVVADLIAEGAAVAATDRTGRSALWYAADNGKHENVGLLVRTGADATVVDRDGNGPLHRAAHHGYDRAIKPLLRAGDATELENESGSTPLVIAAVNGYMGIVRDLVTSGHDLDHQNGAGNTAILIAAQRGDANIVSALLDLGADPSIVNRGRLNVADIAERFGHQSVVGVLDR